MPVKCRRSAPVEAPDEITPANPAPEPVQEPEVAAVEPYVAPTADAFAHLHVHSDFSTLDGLNEPYTLVRTAGHLGQTAIALTDHGRVAGTVDFWDAIAWYNKVHAERHSGDKCKPDVCHSLAVCRDLDRCPKKGTTAAQEVHGVLPPIRGILGVETYVAHHGIGTRIQGDQQHLVLLAANDIGWGNLRTLTSDASIKGFYSKPRIDLDMLRQSASGLIGLSSCLSSHVATVLREQGAEATDELIRDYLEIFGGNFYLELQWHLDQDLACARCETEHAPDTLHDRPCGRQQHDLNRYLLGAAERTGARLVVTNDLHYAVRRDAPLEEILLANATGMDVSRMAELKAAGKATLGFDTPDFYIKSREEMRRALIHWYKAAEKSDPAVAEKIAAGANEWMDRTLEIADLVAYEQPFPDSTPKFPQFPVPEGHTAETYLADRVWAKADGRYGKTMKEATKRLIAYEMQCINELGFAPYFLITEDFVDYARDQGIPVGLGRGSAPGSVITYVLGITDLDPIHYGLTEGGIGLTRFLNPTVTYTIDNDTFGALPAEYAEMETPSVDAMLAELSDTLNARYKAKLEELRARPLSGDDKTRWDLHRAAMVTEWQTIKRWAHTSGKLHTSNLAAPLWRWLQHIKAGAAPGDRNDCLSLVAELLGLTTSRPRLLDGSDTPFLPAYHFELSRIGMPDIDIDFEPGEFGREKVMRYVADKYGHDRVCQISTYGTMQPRLAFRDVARAMGFDPKEADSLSKLIPDKFGASDDEGDDTPDLSLREMINSAHSAVVSATVEMRAAMNANSRVKEAFTVAARLEGTRRGEGTHACGVLITPLPFTEYVAVRRTKEREADNDAVQAVFDGPTLTDKLGLLKVDFLGLKNLRVMREATERISERRGLDLDWIDVPDDDREALRLLREGYTGGIFQFSSDFATGIVRRMKPRRVQDLMAATALGRPGPMQYIPNYIEARARGHGDYGDPIFAQYAEPILAETYGILVYQEQVMRLAIELSGFTLPESDGLRKATAKKDAEKLASFRDKFVEGAVAKGTNREYIGKYWDDVLTPFAAYSFNKSHSTAYALFAYKQAFIKAHYTPEFMAALMSVNQHESKKKAGGKGESVAPIVGDIAEARRMGFAMRSIDINVSTNRIEIEETNETLAGGGKLPLDDENWNRSALRASFSQISGIGEKPVEAILVERRTNGPFADFVDFLFRCVDVEKKTDETGKAIPNPVTKTVVVNLIKCGAFDAFDSRPSLLRRYEAFNKTKSVRKRDMIDWTRTPDYDPSAPRTIEELEWEKELLGVYASAHPADLVSPEIRDRANGSTIEALGFENVRDRDERRIIGVLRGMRWIEFGASGRYMGKIDDGHGEVSFLFWKPKPEHGEQAKAAFNRFRASEAEIASNAVLLIGGYGNHAKFGPQFNARDFELAPLPRLAPGALDPLLLELPKKGTVKAKSEQPDLFAADAAGTADSLAELLGDANDRAA